MRIQELRLISYGPFTDTVVDLSDGHEGLHIVYGPNEAGKSSALRALRHLFYGIPERSVDDFIHPYAKMRIGAFIRSGSGDVLEFVRRKGRGKTLRAADDTTVLGETELQRFLQGISADVFVTMFGIGYDDLVRGGQEIIHGGGDVGRLVFAAGSGISNVREVLEELHTQADQLFRPSAQKPRINDVLNQLNRRRKELRDAQLPGQEWVTHDGALREALGRGKNTEAELSKNQKQLNRLKRIGEALPVIARRRELQDEFKSYASAVLLPEEFSVDRRKKSRDFACHPPKRWIFSRIVWTPLNGT